MTKALKNKIKNGAKAVIATPLGRRFLIGLVAGGLAIVGISIDPETHAGLDAVVAALGSVL